MPVIDWNCHFAQQVRRLGEDGYYVESIDVEELIAERFPATGGEGAYVLELGPLEDFIIPKWKARDIESWRELIRKGPKYWREEEDKFVIPGTLETYEWLDSNFIHIGFASMHSFELKRILEMEKCVYVGKFSGSSPSQRIKTHTFATPMSPKVTDTKLTRTFQVKSVMDVIYCKCGESKELECKTAFKLRDDHPKWHVHFW